MTLRSPILYFGHIYLLYFTSQSIEFDIYFPVYKGCTPSCSWPVGKKMWYLCLLNLHVYSHFFSSFKFFFSAKGTSFPWSLIIGFTSMLYVCYVFFCNLCTWTNLQCSWLNTPSWSLVLLKWCWNWCVLSITLIHNFLLCHSRILPESRIF